MNQVTERRPRVLLVSAVSDLKGGAEVVIQTILASHLYVGVLAVPFEGPLAEAARKLGITVCFYRPTAMLEVHRPPRLMPMVRAVLDAVRCAARLRRLMREHRCDLIHSHSLKPHVLLAMLGVLRLAPTVVHMHDIAYSRAERIIWRVLAACTTRTVLVSRPCFPGKVLPNNVRLILNGVDPVQAVWPPPPHPGGKVRLGFVGRFHENKGLDLLLDWVKALRADGMDLSLTLRGRPDAKTPDYWPRIQARIVDEGLADIMHYEGWRPRSEVYSDLDVLLVPSCVPEPGPLVVLEGMSAGLVVVGYPSGGIPMLIQPGTGLLATEPKEVVEQLQAVIREPGAFAAMQRRGSDRVIQEFSPALFQTRLRDLYREILGWPTEAVAASQPAPALPTRQPARAM